MTNEIVTYVIPAIIGAIAGAIVSLFAPWVKWGVEKRKIKLKNRMQLISETRVYLENFAFDYTKFRISKEYSQIRNYLSENMRNKIERIGKDYPEPEKEYIEAQIGGRNHGANNYRNLILDELYFLEKKWNLI